MEEKPFKILNLIDKLTGEVKSPSTSSSTDPSEHHRQLCTAATTFTLHQSWCQPTPSTTKKRKGEVPLIEEEESVASLNHPKRQKVVLSEHENVELEKQSGLVMEDNDDKCLLSLTLGVSPFSTTGPNDDENDKKDGLLKRKRESREAKFDDDDESFLRLTVRPSDHYQQLVEEKESTSPINYLKRRKVVLSDHENTELKKKSGLVMEYDDDTSIISLNLGVLPVSTTQLSTDDHHEKENKDHQQLKKKSEDPVPDCDYDESLPTLNLLASMSTTTRLSHYNDHENVKIDQLKERRENQVGECDDDDSVLKLTVVPNDHHHHRHQPNDNEHENVKIDQLEKKRENPERECVDDDDLFRLNVGPSDNHRHHKPNDNDHENVQMDQLKGKKENPPVVKCNDDDSLMRLTVEPSDDDHHHQHNDNDNENVEDGSVEGEKGKPSN